MTARETDGPDGVANPLDWPAVTAATRPWTRWWWLGNAVEDGNLDRELSRLDEAGFGGVEITPIYEVEGEEHRSLDFLSDDWIGRFETAVEVATDRGMGVDAVPGTGWHFGGPEVGFADSAMKFDAETTRLHGDGYEAAFDPERLQTVVAYADDGRSVELTDEVDDEGHLSWQPDDGDWSVVAIVGKMGRDVKRAAPDREGPMVSPFRPAAMRRYLGRFDREFADYDGPPLRATFHDSFEFDAHWSPLLLDAFAESCGYRLQDHLPELLGDHPDEERVGRVKADYRRVLSDLYAETITEWTRWNHADGRQARFQAHCAPGNILDLYALADVPETEFIDEKRNILGSKLASSAGHVSGSRRISAETATWLDKHFTVSLGQLKEHVDELFLSGVNHVVFHGTAYAPDDAPWPGWLFYAATQLNPRNPIWTDLPALTEYVTRCQSVLQSGSPDNDVLLYWNVEDAWHAEDGFAERLNVLQEEWFESYSFGRVARWLWEQGYSFDFVSDQQLRDADVTDGRVAVAGGEYETVIVPETDHAPAPTVEALRDLADAGATVGFETAVPDDMPGLGDLDDRRSRLAAARDDLRSDDEARDGRVLIDDVPDLLPRTAARREALVDEGLQFVRRSFDGGTHYFVVNRAETAVEGWLPLAADAESVARLDPMSGDTTAAPVREGAAGVEAYCRLGAGDSVVLRALAEETVAGEPAGHWREGDPVAVEGPWAVEFTRGGPERPPGAELSELRSWTELSDLHERFAGTACYETTVDRPDAGESWWLDLGEVADSATVWLNGERLGTALRAPFRVPVEDLDATDNTLRVEVTNRAANRVRDLDRRGVDWKRFGDINLVGRDYEPFDAADWDVRPAGLLGPVELVPRDPRSPGAD